MNKIFKVVWSKVRNAYVVVSEIAKNTVSGVGKRNRVKRFSMGATLAAVALTSSFFVSSEGLAADSALIDAEKYCSDNIRTLIYEKNKKTKHASSFYIILRGRRIRGEKRASR